ncbi:MAG: EamA family transporter [Chloroflexi bacterium]|nr:EamA family transporter [Chloroflexota bacterium]
MALAILFGFLAALGFGSGAIFARLGLQRLSPKVGVFVSVCTSFLFTSVLVLLFHTADVLSLTPIAFLWFFFFALITFPLARLFNYSAINLAGASRSTPMLAVSPVFATVIAMITLGERPNLLIGLGILVTAWRSWPRRYMAPAALSPKRPWRITTSHPWFLPPSPCCSVP